MKKLILAILMVAMIVTPCFAQELEPDGMFSLEGTEWQTLPIALVIFPYPWIYPFGASNFGFYGGKVYRGYEEDLEVDQESFYLDLLVYSIFSTGYPYKTTHQGLTPLQIGGVPSPEFWGILQPIGIGMVIAFGYTSYYTPMIYITLLIKVDDDWTPPPEDEPTTIETEYDYTMLLPPEWHSAFVEAINENGVVVGSGFDGILTKGFIYQNGEYTELLPPGWESAEAEDINNNGVVVGFGHDGITTKCFMYDTGEYTELLPPGWKYTGPLPSYVCINDSGVVVGSGFDGTAYKSFIYNDGEYVELLPPAWENAEATGINNNGAIIGNGGNFRNEHMGFIYDDGEFTELLPPGWMDAFIFALNDNREVVGSGNVNSSIYKSFVFKDGEYAELSDQMYRPSDINNNEVVIGHTYGPLGSWESRSFVCKDSDECTELSPPGYMYTVCKSINDEGVVAGYAVSVDRGRFTRGPHGFIASPRVPTE